jgi:membrane protein implicated in regulation of membrane protease activity
VLLLGDIFDAQHLHMFEPAVSVGGLTAFGGAGVLLTRYTTLGAAAVLAGSLLLAVALSLAVYFLYVRRMKQAENSIGMSIRELAGRIGEVSAAIPPQGYGEVVVKAGAGLTNQIAASFEGESLEAGARVVVVEVKGDTVYVSRLEKLT